jgi:hypothetical protein
MYAGATAPDSPTTGSLWWETDTNIMWFWNGTYWLSCQLFECTSNLPISASANGIDYRCPLAHTSEYSNPYDIFFVDHITVSYVSAVNGGNDGNDYWDLKVSREGPASALLSDITTAALAPGTNVWTLYSAAINAYYAVGAGTSNYILFSWSKGGAGGDPGNLFAQQRLTYRLVH